MTVALGLVAYAIVLGFLAPWPLRAPWSARSPRVAIALWQAVSLGTLLALVVAGLTLLAPLPPFAGNVGAYLHACVIALRHVYGSASDRSVHLAGFVLAALISGRVLQCLVRSLLGARHARARHRDALCLAARASSDLGAVLLDDRARLAYCVPGRQGQIVLTTGALEVLSADEVGAVLAHERAHLRGRHHLVIVLATGLARAFPHSPSFRSSGRRRAR